MAPFQLTLSLLLVVLTTSGNAASTTWETHPSHPTLPGTVPNCNKWYTAKKGDDCSTVQRECGISADDFFRWNPSVSKDCKENFWADTSYCVGVGPAITTGTPTPTVPPSTTTPTQSTETTPISSSPSSNGTSDSAPSGSPTTKETYTFNHPITTWTPPSPTRETAWPPTKTQPGQPTSCTRWHEVMVGDTCDTIASRYSSWITKEDLLEWNLGLQENCDAPLVGNFLCVMTRPSGYTLTYPNNSTPVVIPTPTPYTPPPPVCPNTTETELTPSPTQPGMPSKCQIYYHATTGDSCSKILSQYNMPEKLLHEWNPALGPDCKGLLPNYYYCLLPDGFRPMPLTVTTAPAPTQTGIASNCKAWYRRNQSETCSDIVLAFGAFSEEDFKAWNPAVGQQCTRLIDGNWYCVAVPGTPTTRTASVPAFPTSVPRQPNVIKNCTSWWHVSHEDDCYDVARKNGITVDEFLVWNPDVRAGQYDCKVLPVDYEVCVGVRPKPPIRGCTPTAGTNTTAPVNTTAAYPTTRKSWHKTLTTTTVVTKCVDASSSTCATATVTTTRVVTLSPPPTAAPPPTGTTTTFVTSPTNSSSGISSPGASSTLPPSSSCASSSSNSSTTPVVPPTTGPGESSSSRPTTRSTQSQDPHSSVTGPPPPAASSTITMTTTITTQCSTTTSTADTSSPDDTTLVTATVTTSCSTTSASITSASSSSVLASSASSTSVSSTSEPDYTEIETTTLTTRCTTTSQSQTASEPSMTIMQG